MAESKRIQLQPPASTQKEKKKEYKPTYRFELVLTPSTDSSCPEFSYADLLRRAKASNRALPDTPFDEEDDEDLQEIARKFEEKYNPKPAKRKKKKSTFCEDYVDRGLGYDETDSFIDNEEAYDELVPSTLTTKHGGFYINKGELEFRNVSESDSGIESKVKRKRRKLKEICLGKDKKKLRHASNDEIPKRRGRKPASETMSALPKPKKKTQQTVADMLQQHKAQLQIQQQEKLQQLQCTPIAVERNLDVHVKTEIQDNILTTPGSASTIHDAIESVVKASAEDAVSNGSTGLVTGSSDGEEIMIKRPMESVEAPKLPENLPSDLGSLVAKLKEAAYNSEEGKCKFFSEDVNRMLLNVELKAQELSSAQRSIIYCHLASHLPCTKETLQKRAKKLRLDQEDNKLREPMQKLKDAIAEVMPEMIKKYAMSLRASNLREREKYENKLSMQSDDDSQDDEDKKPQLKKKFEWNHTTRKYLCDVVRIKLKCYEVSKTRIQSAEEYLRHFLGAEVKLLWPPGWMQARTLFKESREAHAYITNRQKKSMLLPKKAVLNQLSPAVMVAVKPAVSILNNTVRSQETNHTDPAPQTERCVPSNVTMPLYIDTADRKLLIDTADRKLMIDTADRKLMIDTADRKLMIDTADRKLLIDTADRKLLIDTADRKLLIDTADRKLLIDTADRKLLIDTADRKLLIDTADRKTTNISKFTGAVPVDDSRQAEFVKSPYQIKSNTPEIVYPPRILAPVDATVSESLVPTKESTAITSQREIEHHIIPGVAHNKQSVHSSSKASDMNTFTEGSLASDMLARIISASLADFPYAGSSTAENIATTKSQSVITSSSSFMHAKDTHVVNSKLPVDLFTSSKRLEDLKSYRVENRKASHESGSHSLLSGNQIESYLNAHLNVKSSDSANSSSSKCKGVSLETTKSVVNLKLKDVMVPQSRQFAEAFEMTPDQFSLRKKQVRCLPIKRQNSQIANMLTSTVNSSSQFPTSSELLTACSSSASNQTFIENAQRMAQDINKFNVPTQGPPLPPYKKRTKYVQSTKATEQWGPYLDSALGASLLEGMKGFPFPVSTLPTPPPAHCSNPPKTSTQIKDSSYGHHVQHNQRAGSLLSPALRLKESRAELLNHSQQSSHVRVPVVDGPRRSSLIKGPWKSNPATPASSTSHSHYLPSSTSSILNPKSSSPNQSGSSHPNPTIVYAHSHSAPLEKQVVYGHNQSQLPLRASPSPVQSHTSRTPPSSATVSLVSQTFLAPGHQSQVHPRSNTPFDHNLASTTTSASLTGTYSFSQEQKTIPRTN